MIDRLVNLLFWWTPLRQAIFAEVHFYDQIDAARNEPTTNLTWEEGGKWYIYLFDDTGHETMTDLWDYLWTRDMEYGLSYR
jgi:hypothetical protein